MSDGHGGLSPSEGGRSEVDPIPVENPPMSEPPKPDPPKPKPADSSTDLPPRRKLSDEEVSLWAAVEKWEGTVNAESTSDLGGKLTPLDNTSLNSTTKGSVRVELEKDTEWSSSMRLVWKGPAYVQSATHNSKIHIDLNPLNPVFGGRNDGTETGQATSSKAEGDVYLTLDCYSGWYELRVPDVKIKTKMTSSGNVTAFQGTINEPISESDEKEESLSFVCQPTALPPFTDPDRPPELKGNAEINATFIVKIHLGTDWTLNSTAIKADPGGPYTVKRGDKVNLDGSRSRPSGQIKEYEWEFAPPDEPPPVEAGYPPYQPPKETKKKSSSATCSVVILGDTKVRLKITSSKGATHVSKWVTIKCTPRKFAKVPVDQVSQVKHPELSVEGMIAFGKNICSMDSGPVGRNEGEHYYHRDQSSHTWKDVGYTVEQVSDTDGPFDGFSYVASHTLKISRQRAVNKKITPEDMSGVYAYNEAHKQPPPPPKKGSTAPHPYTCGCDRLARCVEAHEQLHTDLIIEAARGSFKLVAERKGPVDPTERIEKLYYETQDELILWTDMEIRYSDMECQYATSGPEKEQEIHAKLVKMGYGDYVRIWMPNGAGGWRTIEGVLGEIGE